MSDGTASLLSGEEASFPQTCQVVGDCGLAQCGELCEFRDAHRSAPFITQNGQEPEAGWVSQDFKLLGKVRRLGCTQRARAEGTTFSAVSAGLGSGGGSHVFSIWSVFPPLNRIDVYQYELYIAHSYPAPFTIEGRGRHGRAAASHVVFS